MNVKVRAKNILADGKANLYLVLYQKKPSREALIHLGKRIDPQYFDNRSGRVSNKYPHYHTLKKILEAEVNKVEAIIFDIESKNEPLTIEKVKRRYAGYTHTVIKEYAQEVFKNLTNKPTEKTIRGYNDAVNNLENYCYKCTFEEVTAEFLADYHFYLTEVKGRKLNGIARDFAGLRRVFTLAMKQGIAKHNPFWEYQIPTETVTKDYCTTPEVDRLYDLFKKNALPEHVNRVLGNYLFSCETGISKDDLDFKRLMVHPEHITFTRGKTKRHQIRVYVPLTARAKALLPFVQANPLITNHSTITAYLSAAMKAAGIDKHITYHTSRSSFYVIAKRAGLDDRAISEILGHKSITTTEKYKRIENTYLKNQVNKINEVRESK